MSIKIALIYGSAREGRFCDKVAQWAAEEVAARGEFAVDVIDPAHDDIKNLALLRDRIGTADAFIVVTPEYNHSYPATLKGLIDSVGQQWQAKPVAFISYGGISGGLRAVEHLRQVFAELHAVGLRDTVSFAQAWGQFDETGQLREPERARKSMGVLLNRLVWWATALTEARNAKPYSTVTAS